MMLKVVVHLFWCVDEILTCDHSYAKLSTKQYVRVVLFVSQTSTKPNLGLFYGLQIKRFLDQKVLDVNFPPLKPPCRVCKK